MYKKNGLLFLLLFHAIILSAQWEVKNYTYAKYSSIYSLKFYDNQNGMAMGTDGLIWKSSDQGEHWQMQETSMQGNIKDFEYLTLDTIIATSAYYDSDFFRFIYKSTDGGSTWVQKYSDEGEFNCVQFLNSSKGFVAGSHKILMTTSGGEGWETVYDMDSNGYSFGVVTGFEMVNDFVGYAIILGKKVNSSTSFQSYIIKTTDGGLSWQEINQLDTWSVDLTFLNKNVGYFASDFDTYKTTDGGISWDTLDNLHGVTDIKTVSETKIVSVHRPDFYIPPSLDNTIYSISTSENAGASWDGEYKDGPHLETIFFQSESVGFVAGQNFIILKTINGGGEMPENYPWGLSPTLTGNTEESPLSFYPNPTVDKIYLESLDSNVSWTYSIQSSSGLVVKEGNLIDDEIDVSDLPLGIFILTIQSDNERRSAKFIKS